MSKKGLIRKIRFISKFITSQPGQQTIAIHILYSLIFETKKFGHLIEYNTRNIFLEKLCAKCSGDTIPRPFSNKLKLSIALGQ